MPVLVFLVVGLLHFAQWEINILGPFPSASWQCKFLFIAVDYFTKWVGAELVPQIIEVKVRDFVWKSIIYRFSLSRDIVIDNDRQFDNKKFKKFCVKLNIEYQLTLMTHP